MIGLVKIHYGLAKIHLANSSSVWSSYYIHTRVSVQLLEYSKSFSSKLLTISKLRKEHQISVQMLSSMELRNRD